MYTDKHRTHAPPRALGHRQLLLRMGGCAPDLLSLRELGRALEGLNRGPSSGRAPVCSRIPGPGGSRLSAAASAPEAASNSPGFPLSTRGGGGPL